MQNKILIIGSLPPPLGGVTIHLQRLLYYCDETKTDYTFLSAKKHGILRSVIEICKHNILHLNISNVYVSFLIVVFSKITLKKVIITRHGNINRNRAIKRLIDIFCIKLATIPILLNQESYEIALSVNKKAIQLSAFIPPITISSLPPNLIEIIKAFRKRYKYLFCTNAFNLSFDSFGHETYGIIPLIEIFGDLPDLALIAATCNSNYINYISQHGITIPHNVYLVDYPIDYISLLKASDASIRNTTTDGDALSIHESLFCGKNVFATDCVPRPKDALLYHNVNDLKQLLKEFTPSPPSYKSESSVYKIIKLYHALMRSK